MPRWTWCREQWRAMLARLMSEDASGVDMRNWSILEFGVQLSLVTG